MAPPWPLFDNTALDNVASNDNMQKILKERLNLLNGLLCKGKYFRVRCCAHILNIIVQEGLKAAGVTLHKIRENVKYVKASEGRLREFQRCFEEVYLSDVGDGFLRLDVTTRWNATYMMLESAIKYHRAFTEMSYYDRSYMLCPTNEEWERVEKINTFLVPFYDITNLISGSSYPTSNLYFTQVSLIEVELNDNMSSEDEVIKDMVTRMKTKFNKYGKNYSVTLALGDVLDPTSMLKFVIVCYKRLYPNDYQEKIDRVKEGLYELFGEYVNNLGASSSSLASASRDTPSHSPMSSGTFRSPILEAYHEEMRQNTSNDGESQLDIYLDEPCIVANNIDFLQYWKLNKCRFPQLAIMTCDILSIPITTVASESTFSIGGRILHKYKNCLLPENVQALICFKEQNTINVE